MRISDWSSDVCSSDLNVSGTKDAHEVLSRLAATVGWLEARLEDYVMLDTYTWVPQIRMLFGSFCKGNVAITDRKKQRIDRKSVVQGKSVSGRVGLGGSRIMKKKKKNRIDIYKH